MKTRLFLAPDIDPSAAAPAIAAADSPTGAAIPVAPAKEAAPVTVIQPKPIVKQSGIIDVKKALGLKESPKKENDAEAAEIGKKAAGETVIPVPKAKKAAKVEPTADEAAATAAAAAKKIEDDKKSAELAAGAPPVPKVKLGGKEMTQEEADKYIADLEKKAKAAAEPPVVKKTEPAAPEITPEAKAAEKKKLDAEFVTKHAQKIGITQERFDKIISDGDVGALNQLFAERELASREWVAEMVNPILKDLADSVDPVLRMHREVAQYQAEAAFHAKPENADLAPHKKTVRMIAETLRTKYPAEYGAMSQAEQEAEIATHTRNFIKEFNVQPEAAKAAPASPNAVVPPVVPAEPPKPKAPQPKPPTGNLGGAPAPVTVGQQKSMIAKLEASGK